MTAPQGEAGPSGREGGTSEDRTARNIGVGCFTTFIGSWSGAMVAVLIGKIVEGLRGAAECQGLPLCNWYVYAAIGAALGAVSLPLLVLTRLRRRDAAREHPLRG